MTEVKQTSSGGNTYGLFATKDYKVGDLILQEDSPLVQLAPASLEVEKDILNSLIQLKQPPNKDPEKLLWSSIAPPSCIDEPNTGKFKGMVQAALCYVQSRLDAAVEAKLMKLYHPALIGSSTPAEAEILELSISAIEYLQKHQQKGSLLQKKLESDCDSLQKVMLLYSCNAFEGGLVYDTISRINHSCDPNAIALAAEGAGANSESKGQCIRALTTVNKGDEIAISYLGLFLYADHSTRQQVLKQQKHFECSCSRCKDPRDMASCIPCLVCHPRTNAQHQLDEDVQYDDEQSVHYMHRCGDHFQCDSELGCKATVSIAADLSNASENQKLFRSIDAVTSKARKFINERPVRSSKSQDEEVAAAQSELLQEHLRLTSSLLGARHWTTNLLLLLHLSEGLENLHGTMLLAAQGQSEEPSVEERMDLIAESIDSLERVVRFVDGLGLRLHMGHLLSDAIIGVARALIGLGDVKSQKYGSEWLDKIHDDYVVHFESDGMQRVVVALRKAWEKPADDQERVSSPNKKAKFS